jgi:cytoskeletal protein CcmA (bactofilin family)
MAESHDGWTVIGADTVIKGEMAVENRARILGRFEGTIRSKGQVEVADKATCKAAVEANTVQVDGTVEGNITATDKVHLNTTARMTGDLIAAKLVVTEGAAFTGHITVGPNALKGRGEAPTRNEASAPREQPGHAGGNDATAREPVGAAKR